MLIRWDIQRAVRMVYENESYMWRYFRKEMLYSDDQKLMPRFINPAPFLNFIWKLTMNHLVKLVVDRMANCSLFDMKTMKYLCNN
jgi:hypothetical protein